jgi:hypothetical protein
MNENTTTPSTVPNPSIMARFVRPVTVAAAPVEPTDPGRIVRPGLVDTVSDTAVHDGVVKAKHLKPGMEVRPFLHGEPRGSVRTVATVKHIRGKDAEEAGLEDGAFVEITYSSQHPHDTGDRRKKAAYRFHDASLAGTPLVVKTPALVAYEQV